VEEGNSETLLASVLELSIELEGLPEDQRLGRFKFWVGGLSQRDKVIALALWSIRDKLHPGVVYNDSVVIHASERSQIQGVDVRKGGGAMPADRPKVDIEATKGSSILGAVIEDADASIKAADGSSVAGVGVGKKFSWRAVVLGLGMLLLICVALVAWTYASSESGPPGAERPPAQR
jgi:hypothetical protein